MLCKVGVMKKMIGKYSERLDIFAFARKVLEMSNDKWFSGTDGFDTNEQRCIDKPYEFD